MKKLFYVALISVMITGCGKNSDTQVEKESISIIEETNVIETKTIEAETTEVETTETDTTEAETTEAETEKLSINTDGKKVYSFYDGGIPGNNYTIAVDMNNRTVSMETTCMSSAVDVEPSTSILLDEFKIEDDDIWELYKDFIINDIDSIYEESMNLGYPDSIIMTGFTELTMAVSMYTDGSEVVAEVTNDITTEIEFYDINKDGEVTVYELIKYSIDILRNEINIQRDTAIFTVSNGIDVYKQCIEYEFNSDNKELKVVKDLGIGEEVANTIIIDNESYLDKINSLNFDNNALVYDTKLVLLLSMLEGVINKETLITLDEIRQIDAITIENNSLTSQEISLAIEEEIIDVNDLMYVWQNNMINYFSDFSMDIDLNTMDSYSKIDINNDEIITYEEMFNYRYNELKRLEG